MTAVHTASEAHDGRDLPRRVAVALLLAIVVVSLGLRLWNRTHNLPHVLHSDYRQVVQGATLLREGSFTHRVPYHAGNSFVHAGAFSVVFAVNKVLGSDESWNAYVNRLRSPKVHHAIGRGTVSVLGSLVAVGVYLMARVRFGRRVALLAAAITAFAPMQIIFSHQARIHVPAIAVLSFAAVPVLSLASGRAKALTAVAAGIGCALAVAMVQYGFLLLGTAGLLTLLSVRPMSTALRLCAIGAVSFLAVHVATLLLMYGTGFAVRPEGESLLTDFWTLGMTESSVALHPIMMPRLMRTWALSEPVRALAVLVFVVACLRSLRRPRDLALYGLYPLLVFAVIGIFISCQPRYAMSTTPFLAVLAAAGAMTLRHTTARRALVVLLLAVPLATSVRYDMLLETQDTRLGADQLVRYLASKDVPIAVNYELALRPHTYPDRVGTIPPGGNYAVVRRGRNWGPELLDLSPAEVFVRPAGPWAGAGGTSRALQDLGFERFGTLAAGGIGTDFLPDAPQQPTIAIWTLPRTGPTIEIWVKSGDARARLEELLPPAAREELGLS